MRLAPPENTVSKKKAKPSDPRHALFVAEAERVYRATRGEPLDFDASDGKNLSGFLARHAEVTLEEWAARWQRAITAQGFLRCARVREFIGKWGHLAPNGAGASVSNFTDRSLYQEVSIRSAP